MRIEAIRMSQSHLIAPETQVEPQILEIWPTPTAVTEDGNTDILMEDNPNNTEHNL